jgi:beta-lactamase class A
MKRFVLFGLFLQVVSVAFSQTANIEKEINSIINGKKATIGIALYDPDNGKVLTIKGNRHFPMQSVYKFPIVLKVLSEVDKGERSLSDSIFISSKDLLPDTWSPIRDKYPNGNIRMSLADIIRYTISQSDNNGCDILLKLVGGARIVNSYIHSLGIKNMNIEKTEAEQHEAYNVQFRNWTTPIVAVQLLKLFYNKKILQQNTHDFLWTTMTETSTGSIKNKIPQSIIVAHKTGSAPYPGHSVTNDIGMISFPNKHTILYAIFIMDSKEKSETDYEIIANIGKILYAYNHNK